MKKILLCFVFVMLFFISFDVINAASCSLEERVRYKELAARIKVTYEGDYVTETSSEGEKYYSNVLYLKIYNVSSEFDYKLTDGKNVINLDYSMLNNDGTITVRLKEVSEIKNYKIDVYPTGSNCVNEKIRTIKVTTPKYNYYSSYDICNDVQDYYMCQTFVFYDVDYDNFYNTVSEYKNKIASQKEEDRLLEESNEKDSVITTASKYKYLLIGGVIALGLIISILVLRKKGSAE